MRLALHFNALSPFPLSVTHLIGGGDDVLGLGLGCFLSTMVLSFIAFAFVVIFHSFFTRIYLSIRVEQYVSSICFASNVA